MSRSREEKIPRPQGKYVPATRFGNIIYTVGMTPRENGIIIQTGKVSTMEPASTYKAAVRQAVANVLNAAMNTLVEEKRLEQILSLSVYVNADKTFEVHRRIAEFASEYLFEKLGDKGIGSRAAIGVVSLPNNAPVEIQMIAVVSS